MNQSIDKVITFLDPAEIEPEALQQIKNVSRLPFIYKWVSVMPDCHYGKGCTVGTVLATKGAIIPAAVGVDIGCGMIAVLTKYTAKDLPDDLSKLRHSIERSIPVSAGRYNTKLTDSAYARVQDLNRQAQVPYSEIDKNWAEQLGTLGGGNHFIEVSLDEQDRVWIVLHSGSRGVGNKIAQKYIKLAGKLCSDMFVNLADPDLAYLPERFPEFKDYIRDLLWAQDFARMSRDEMMDRVLKDFSFHFYGEGGHEKEIEQERINCHHNFTQQENHFGENVWLTRKGAIQMKKGQLGIIPGSMGTRSYIVEGLENPLSFHSAPHGAGRRMSRNKAKQTYKMEDLEAAMKGIEFRKSDAFIDEIPAAYKDIDQVMENSKELVSVRHTLRQVLNVKGD